jgi:hypothetical protein
MNEILLAAPSILEEMTAEFLRRGDEEFRKQSASQVAACLYLAIRSASLLYSMGKLLTQETSDGFEVLARAFLEARDLLTTFRFDHKGTKDQIGRWFKGDLGNSWNADRKKCDEYLERLGHSGSELHIKWRQMTTLAHPTVFAAQNSIVSASIQVRARSCESMEAKNADYLASIASLVVFATIDPPGLLTLGYDLNRMPNIDSFQTDVARVVLPILRKTDNDLPPESYRA